nr:DEAD/DEAH box helicase [Bacilli bacterium]
MTDIQWLDAIYPSKEILPDQTKDQSLLLFRLAYDAHVQSCVSFTQELLCLQALPSLKPYTHQQQAVHRVLFTLRGRALLADEVGLGKTIEAGMILKEYLLRHIVKRALILVPASLVLQWTRELHEKFEIEAHAMRNEVTIDTCDIVVASMDTVKKEPYRALVLAKPYDLVIVDEAHKMKNNKTQLWQLINQMQKKHLLLLTATPLQNDRKELYHLFHLLRPGHLGDKREYLKAHQEGTSTLKAIDTLMIRHRRKESDVIFTKRNIRTMTIELSDKERYFYNEVTTFIREQYEYRRQKKRSILPLITLQREICSSTYAAMVTLETMMRDPTLTPTERFALRRLLQIAEQVTVYTKVDTVIDLVQAINDKTILFTEYKATQDFLYHCFTKANIRSVLFRGGFKRGKKDWMKDLFEHQAQVLIATQAAGEGINLQFCNQVINFDLPWNPMRIEQRIGRVHRIGQEREVFIYNLSTAGTIEEHIVSLLEDKIALFERVIGELDVILGPKAFERDVMEAYMQSMTNEELRARLTMLAKRVR